LISFAIDVLTLIGRISATLPCFKTTKMKLKPLILVIGATGAQGGSVARHLLNSRRFAVRALTRNPEREKAKALQEAGAAIVAGDLSDKASLVQALHDVDGVYGVTNFWEHFAGEWQQGVNLVDAVVESGVKQFVFSTLPHVYGISNGAISVPHFDIKAQLEAYARSKKPDTTFVHPAFYFQNFTSFITPKKGADGSYFISFPQGDAPLAGLSANDIGGIVLPVFESPQAFAGKTIAAAGEVLTGAEYAAVLSQVTGKKIVYQYMPRKTFAAQNVLGAEEMANMFEYYRLYKPYGTEAVTECRQLYPALENFETTVRKQKEALLALM
jgi:uncharacterized protein YbjT (DUF2867 family)